MKVTDENVVDSITFVYRIKETHTIIRFENTVESKCKHRVKGIQCWFHNMSNDIQLQPYGIFWFECMFAVGWNEGAPKTGERYLANERNTHTHTKFKCNWTSGEILTIYILSHFGSLIRNTTVSVLLSFQYFISN